MKAKLEHITAKMRAKREWTTNYYREWTRSLFNGKHFSSKKVYYIPPPLTVHFPMTRSMRYQPIFNGLKFMLHRALILNNVVITTVIEMVEMVEILDGRVCNRSVERKVCNKQFINLGHCEIWSHFTRTLYFHSPSARDNSDASHEISHHISC